MSEYFKARPVTDLPLFAEPEPWCHIADAPEDPVFRELVTLARQFAAIKGARGVILGEVIEAYEQNGRRVGGVPMEDKVKEQRQTSWLPRVMKAAGLVATDRVRPSPVVRHHSHRHTVWVLPAYTNQESAA